MARRSYGSGSLAVRTDSVPPFHDELVAGAGGVAALLIVLLPATASAGN